MKKMSASNNIGTHPIFTLIRQVAVLGAGVMGAQIAAHFANAGISVILLDMSSEGDRSRIAREGLERAKKSKPSPFYLPEMAERITVGNFEDDLSKLSTADWIIEAVVERLDVKRELLSKVERVRRENVIVTTNTSGIKIGDIAAGFSAGFKPFFLGAHFFNPPRYMKLVELIPMPETSADVIEQIDFIAREVLGKRTVRCKDTPDFIANRIGIFAVSFVLNAFLQSGFSIEEIDSLTGPVIGRPRAGTFRTLDLVGLDVFVQVADHLYPSIPNDEMRETFKPPDFLRKMVEKGWLGEKTGQGFYKRVKREDGGQDILTLDLSTMEYKPRKKTRLNLVELANAKEKLDERIRSIADSKDPAAAFFWKTTAATLAYASNRIPEISESIEAVDNAMRWGFGWGLGPFELWDVLGVSNSIPRIEQEGFRVAPWVSAKNRLYERGRIESDSKVFNLSSIQQIVKQNSGASLIELGDGVLCLEFHSKMNTIGEEILTLGNEAIEKLEQSYDALVIGNQGENFCVGANLMMILMLAQEEEWEEIEKAIKLFQQFNQRIKFAKKPVIVAPFGQTLGGGCEIALHSSKAVAAAETYMGLVELGAGVIPAGGGTKEMVARSGGNPLLLTKYFETMAMAKVSTSALHAKKLGFLRDSDAISMNPDYLLYEAKQAALAVAKTWQPRIQGKILALGKVLYGALSSAIDKRLSSKQISDYDAHLAKKLAYVMAGGDHLIPVKKSEDDFLNLEREAFLSLCRERKTQERMQHLLKTGKPLRN